MDLEFCAEEQAMEMEALSHIFEKMDTISPTEFMLHISPPESEACFIKVRIVYEPAYPAEGDAIFTVEGHKGVPPDVVTQLKELIATRAGEFSGMGTPYVFDVMQEVTDTIGSIAGLNSASAYDEMMMAERDAAAGEAEEEIAEAAEKVLRDENAADDDEHGIMGGEPVTEENFKTWWAAFIVENNINTAIEPEHTGLTGRQIFEKGEAEEA